MKARAQRSPQAYTSFRQHEDALDVNANELEDAGDKQNAFILTSTRDARMVGWIWDFSKFIKNAVIGSERERGLSARLCM